MSAYTKAILAASLGALATMESREHEAQEPCEHCDNACRRYVAGEDADQWYAVEFLDVVTRELKCEHCGRWPAIPADAL